MDHDMQTIQIGDVALSLDEAAETLDAIRGGRVDAVVVEGLEGHEVFTFRDPSHPFRLLVEAMSEGAMLATPDGIVSYLNPRFSELVGVEAGTMQGHAIEELVWPDARGALADLLERAREGGSSRGPVQLIASDGLPVRVLLSISRACLADVEVLCVVATDLTEQTRQEDLYHAAREEIEERDRLFAVASHELRNPLGVLELQARLLEGLLESHGGGETLPVDRAKEMVTKLRLQAGRLARLVTNLLDVGSIGAGRLRLAREEFDFGDAVRAALELARDEIARSGSPIEVDVKPVRGCWDRVRVEQMIVNLVTNAAKYGLGRPIRIAVSRSGGLACLRVEDQGRGVPAEARERIFRPYERVVHGGRSIPGLGIGLYVTSEMIKAHGGTIRVEDRPGGGSRFTVELPLHLAG